MTKEQQEKKDRTDYYHHYYLERKKSLSEKRHDLYHGDPEYREKAKESSRVYRERKKEEKEQLRAEGKLPPPKKRGARPPLGIVINGEKYRAHTITTAAQQLRRSVTTLNYWTRIGLLPVTPIRSNRGERLYTDAMILVMQMAISKRGKVSLKDDKFYQEVVDGWSETGVFIC